MNCIYLVDFLSVGEKGLSGIEKTDASDKIYIYYNSIKAKAAEDTIVLLRKYKDIIELCETGIFPGMTDVLIAEAFGQMVCDMDTSCVFVVSARNSLKMLLPLKNTRHTKYAISSSIDKCIIPSDEEVATETKISSNGIGENADIDLSAFDPSVLDDDSDDDDFAASVNDWDQTD